MKLINKKLLKCPTCDEYMTPATNLDGGESSFWMRCTKRACRTFVDTYIPLDHQVDIHEDTHKLIGIFGGYGSGKTVCAMKDDEKHMLSTPNGTTVVGAAVLAQVEQTYEKDFRKDFPKELVRRENKSKKTYTLMNGHTVFVKSLYDEELIRSITASRVHMLEASAVDYELFVQLKNRMRDVNAMLLETDENGDWVYDPVTKFFKVKVDWSRCLVESNPSNGWIRDDFLLVSSSIIAHNTHNSYVVKSPDKFVSSHIIPTSLNKFLPPDFEEMNSKGKPLWWIKRYMQGSFDYAEGMVYPNVQQSFVKRFNIPDDWVRVVSMDYGINDETCFLFGAISKENGVLYIFAGIYVNNNDYKSLSRMYWEEYKVAVPLNQLYTPPVMDARSIAKRNDYNLKKIGELFQEEGIYFKPAQMDLDARIIKTNTFINLDKVKIFDDLEYLYKELIAYKFPERTADGKSRGDKPVDKNNHAISALEFMIMELPDDLHNLENRAYTSDGAIMRAPGRQRTPQTSLRSVYVPWDNVQQPKKDQGKFGNLYNEKEGWEIDSW